MLPPSRKRDGGSPSGAGSGRPPSAASPRRSASRVQTSIGPCDDAGTSRPFVRPAREKPHEAPDPDVRTVISSPRLSLKSSSTSNRTSTGAPLSMITGVGVGDGRGLGTTRPSDVPTNAPSAYSSPRRGIASAAARARARRRHHGQEHPEHEQDASPTEASSVGQRRRRAARFSPPSRSGAAAPPGEGRPAEREGRHAERGGRQRGGPARRFGRRRRRRREPGRRGQSFRVWRLGRGCVGSFVGVVGRRRRAGLRRGGRGRHGGDRLELWTVERSDLLIGPFSAGAFTSLPKDVPYRVPSTLIVRYAAVHPVHEPTRFSDASNTITS